jgi:hypothetical protein
MPRIIARSDIRPPRNDVAAAPSLAVDGEH